ncbi:MAG: metallophosphoesterase [archaeon]
MTERKEVIDFASEKSIILENSAIQLIIEQEIDFKELIEKAIEENVFVVTRKMVEEKIVQRSTKLPSEKKEETAKKSFSAKAEEIESNYKILEELNVTNQSCSEGKIKDFIEFFRDKFNSIELMLKERGLINKPLKRLKTVSKNNEVDLIVMVAEKWKTKKGHIAFKLEDLEAQCIGIILKDDARLMKLSERILLDNVIGLKAVKGNDEMVIIKDVIFPEIPLKSFKTGKRDLFMACISDMHVGSKLFLEDSFEKFVSWLKGNTENPKEKEIINKIKYLCVLGDNVDGIGVYPDQFNELSIKDIKKQYKKFTELMLEIPSYIEVFIIPGQHDAVRFSDPQPAIPKEFVEELYGKKNFHFLSSPGWAEIEGLKTLFYHGPSLHDLYSSVSFLSYSNPAKAIEELIKKRDLMPVYGLKRPYVPEKNNYMVLKEIPDIYLGGDLHHTSIGLYRGTRIISCGTFQEKTAFQVQQGHVPTPGVVVLLELKTGNVFEKNFYKEEKISEKKESD